MSLAAEARTVRSVGIAGWGRMGSQLGVHLVSSGWRVAAYDPDPTTRASMSDCGATPVGSVGQLAASTDLIIIVVVDEQQVAEVLDEALPNCEPGAIVAVCASISPHASRRLSQRASEAGCFLVDVGLVGGERAALEATLTLMCGVEREVLGAGSGANRALEDWGTHRLRWPKKDLELAIHLARQNGVEMPLIEALVPLIEELDVSDLQALR